MVRTLNEGLSQKLKVLDDDASFLLEVKEGQSAAVPDMNPDRELEALKLRFAIFQEEFKVPYTSPTRQTPCKSFAILTSKYCQ